MSQRDVSGSGVKRQMRAGVYSEEMTLLHLSFTVESDHEIVSVFVNQGPPR